MNFRAKSRDTINRKLSKRFARPMTAPDALAVEALNTETSGWWRIRQRRAASDHGAHIRRSNARARLARPGNPTQALTSHDSERGICVGGDMAHKSQFSIVTYQRSLGHWRAAISPYAHSGIFVLGRAAVSFITPDDYASEPDAVFAAEKIIQAL
jgi:hypothetical protein